jgi:hypothetical protein
LTQKASQQIRVFICVICVICGQTDLALQIERVKGSTQRFQDSIDSRAWLRFFQEAQLIADSLAMSVNAL